MLTQINIHHYTVIDSLVVELEDGFTVITGETGAGKSIMLDALGLCLGDRADTSAIRPGSDKADISAVFDVSKVTEVQNWLKERELECDAQCILRRVITREGRSRAYINGKPATLQDCAALGENLVDIHSQHAHQSLLRRRYQRELLDHYAGNGPLLSELQLTVTQWQEADETLRDLLGRQQDRDDREQLLRYQVDELDELGITATELTALEAEQHALTNAETIQQQANSVERSCDEYGSGVRRAIGELDERVHEASAIEGIKQMLDTAAIHLEEAGRELERYLAQTEVNPQRLTAVSERLDRAYGAARKHRVRPEDLEAQHRTLTAELASLDASDERINDLQQQVAELESRYQEQAGRLAKARRSAAKKLEREVQKQLKKLAMASCRFVVDLIRRQETRPQLTGMEDVGFLIATTPNADLQDLAKVASGGELSRISLAIQVATAGEITVPSMVFDEVDVGIGGGVAEVVGRLLADIGKNRQVLCVTHLPQVASQGDQHLRVERITEDGATRSELLPVAEKNRVEEIARMLGGLELTKNTLAHAQEMLERS
ncbi:MAG: DNA repair protein RecN [Pseudomonadota bacterium]